MTPRQLQVWAFVSFGVGIVLTAWMVLGTFVFDVSDEAVAAVFWGAALLFLFITAIRFTKGEPRQGEGEVDEEERPAKRAREGLTPEEQQALRVLRRGLEMRRQPVRR